MPVPILIASNELQPNFSLEILISSLIFSCLLLLLDGDTFFPYLEKEKWKEIDRSFYARDEKHKYDFTFLTYDKNF